jgi:hypothetical protein
LIGQHIIASCILEFEASSLTRHLAGCGVRKQWIMVVSETGIKCTLIEFSPLGIFLSIVMVSIATDTCMIIYPSIYINRFCDFELGSSDITKFRVSIAMNFRMLTLSVNLNYSVGHE